MPRRLEPGSAQWISSGHRTMEYLDELAGTQLRGSVALEIGCGSGRLTTALVERFTTVIALDVSHQADRRLQNPTWFIPTISGTFLVAQNNYPA